MLYMNDDNKSKLHLVMLSPNTSERNLHFYVNRSMTDTVMTDAKGFADAITSAPDISPTGYGVTSVTAFCLRGLDNCTVPADDDGIVIRVQLMPGIENPTKAIAKLGASLARHLSVSLYDLMISGHIGQSEPFSYTMLESGRFQGGYLDAFAKDSLPAKELVGG